MQLLLKKMGVEGVSNSETEAVYWTDKIWTQVDLGTELGKFCLILKMYMYNIPF